MPWFFHTPENAVGRWVGSGKKSAAWLTTRQRAAVQSLAKPGVIGSKSTGNNNEWDGQDWWDRRSPAEKVFVGVGPEALRPVIDPGLTEAPTRRHSKLMHQTGPSAFQNLVFSWWRGIR